MGSLLGSIVETVLVRGLLALEHVFPMPARLGTPLPPGTARSKGADPVVLIGGFANSMSGWGEWKRSLEADGFDVYIFDPPTVGLGDMEESAEAVAAFIADVRRRTGRKVDVIGFSEGGILARMAVARLGSLGSVDRLMSLATPHRGVNANWVYHALKGVQALLDATPKSAVQLLRGSELLTSIERDDEHLRRGRDPRAPRYASIHSRTIDMFVHPVNSWLEGAVNIPVQGDQDWRVGPNHFEMLHTSDRAYEAARILLLDGSPRAAAIAGLAALER